MWTTGFQIVSPVVHVDLYVSIIHVFYQFLSMECNILYYVWILILK